jgi:hypothetical protein
MLTASAHSAGAAHGHQPADLEGALAPQRACSRATGMADSAAPTT